MIYIALGSNLGDSRNLIHSAIDRIELDLDGHLVKSSLWSSEPIDCPEGSADFVNAMVGFEALADQDPFKLLQHLQALEHEFGRPTTRARNSARCLDLDIICYGDRVLTSTELTIPHPRAHERAFVLLPLQEIAPELVFPDSGRSVNELAAMVSRQGMEKL
jgi:2-amino-4-hydroxy-6-hydroxymethyldihydropteridine diphosphokinase